MRRFFIVSCTILLFVLASITTLDASPIGVDPNNARVIRRSPEDASKLQRTAT
ncbi:hypothetical protein BDF19DRAFT_426575 [Syncephalis fuscata]|nr:hypothetical protein BDF19DRAFT_426575 [Syncephalis fuscata]